MNPIVYLILSLSLVFFACDGSLPNPDGNAPEETPAELSESVRVTDVKVSGQAGSYSFSVSLQSPDTGCDQYADWWEVFLPDSTLKYRRILAHSHVNEQPFTRSGGPVDIQEDEFVYVRGHMNNLGYGEQVFSGSVSAGFKADNLDIAYAKGLASTSPLPEKCDF